ncbi:MAG: class I SAM-dependent methyltransferase [Thermoanaerobaculia bacterium]
MRTEGCDWERLGALEPYFAVLTETRFLRANLTAESLAAFFASGEADVARLAALAAAESGEDFRPVKALEFGCGVGRLTFPIARRADAVVGVDVAPSLLALAEAEAMERNVRNITLLPVEQLSSLSAGTFDFIYSYIVFQHIPVAIGEKYVTQLLRLATPTATVVLHFALSRPGGIVRRLLRSARAHFPQLHRFANFVEGRRDLPYMQMNTYDTSRIEKILLNAGFRRPRIEVTNHGGIAGGVFVSSRCPPA